MGWRKCSEGRSKCAREGGAVGYGGGVVVVVLLLLLVRARVCEGGRGSESAMERGGTE